MLSKKNVDWGLLSFRYFGTALCKWCDKRGDNHREHLHLYLRAAQNTKEQQWEKKREGWWRERRYFKRARLIDDRPALVTLSPSLLLPLSVYYDDDDCNDDDKVDEFQISAHDRCGEICPWHWHIYIYDDDLANIDLSLKRCNMGSR